MNGLQCFLLNSSQDSSTGVFAGAHQQQLQESKRRVRRLEAQEAVAQGKLAQQQDALEAQKQQLKDLQVILRI